MLAIRRGIIESRDTTDLKRGFLSAQPGTAYTHWSIIGLFVLAAIVALAYAQAFFIPVVFAILIALILSPIRRALGGVGISPPFAAALIMTLLCTAGVVTLFLISNSLATLLSDEPQLMNKVRERIDHLTGVLEPVRQAGEQLEAMQQNGAANAPERVVVREEHHRFFLERHAHKRVLFGALFVRFGLQSRAKIRPKNHFWPSFLPLRFPLRFRRPKSGPRSIFEPFWAAQTCLIHCK